MILLHQERFHTCHKYYYRRVTLEKSNNENHVKNDNADNT